MPIDFEPIAPASGIDFEPLEPTGPVQFEEVTGTDPKNKPTLPTASGETDPAPRRSFGGDLPTPESIDEQMRQMRAGVARGGKLLLAGVADLATLYPGGQEPNAANIRAFMQDPEAPLPVQEGLEETRGVARFAGKASAGLLQVAPALATTRLLAGQGVPPAAAAATPFLFDETGQMDPVGAAIAAGLPGVTRLGEKAVAAGLLTLPSRVTLHVLSRDPLKFKATITQKAGGLEISNDTFRAWLEHGGGLLAANAYLAAAHTPAILALPEHQRPEATLDMIAGQLAVSLTGFAARRPVSRSGRYLMGKAEAAYITSTRLPGGGQQTTASEFGGLSRRNAPPQTVEGTVAPAKPTAEGPAVVPLAPAPSPATPPTDLGVTGVPVQRVDAGAIAARPELMQFKRMDDAQAGINQADKLEGQFDDLKAGNLLLWEPTDPAQYGLEAGQRYIVANGHHRFEFGHRTGQPGYNAQVIQEADYSLEEARALAAEINIADGKGTIYDQAKFLRNTAATHGPHAALAAAGRIGPKGRQAATIAQDASPDTYTSFINEQISPQAAEAIAAAAPISADPINEGLQRVGIRKALEGRSPQELRNLIQAVRLEARGQTAQQFDLFAADDTALQTAEQLAKVASRIQSELGREIRATENAARQAQTAQAKGIKFNRPPQEILAENEQLKLQRAQWDNWALHPELVQQVRDYAQMGRETGAVKEPAGPYNLDKPTGPDQSLADAPPAETEAWALQAAESYQQAELLPVGTGSAGVQQPGDPTTGAGRTKAPRAPVSNAKRRELDAVLAAVAALKFPTDTASWRKAWKLNQQAVSLLDPQKAPSGAPSLNIIGAKFESPLDFALALMPLRSPYQESLKVCILNDANQVVHSEVLYTGTIDTITIRETDFVRLGELHKAKGKRIIFAHNHPGGDPSPSTADINITRNIRAVAEAAGFEVVDHVITNGKTFTSERGGWAYDAIKPAQLAAWERMPAMEALVVDNSAKMGEVVASLRQSDPHHAHVLFLNTRRRLTAVYRTDLDKMAMVRALRQGGPIEGATAVLVDMGDLEPSAGPDALRALRRWGQSLRIEVLDATWQGIQSAREAGFMYDLSEPSPAYTAEGVVNEPGPQRDPHYPEQPPAGVNNESAPEYRERETGRKISASELSPQTKAAITEYFYEVRHNRTDQQIADGIVAQHGVEQAFEAWRNPPTGLPGAVRVKLLRAITRTLNAQEQAARQAGDLDQADALARKAGRIWDEALPQITDTAQTLQALADMVELSPAAQVARARRQIDQANQDRLDQHRGEINLAIDALRQGRREGVETVRVDPEVNTAARQAVDAAASDSTETRRAIVMDLAGPWAESPTILKHARDQVRAKANELLNRQPRPAGLTPRQHLRAIMDDLAARAASIFAAHIQGADPGTPLVDKLQQRLGLDRPRALKLASALSREFDRQVDLARKTLPKKLAAARAKALKGLEPGATDDAVDRAIHRQLTEWNFKLGELLDQAQTARDETGQHVADALVAKSGLTGPEAEALARTLRRRWDAIVEAKQRAALVALQKRSQVKVGRQVKTAFDRAVQMERLGALNPPAMLDLVRDVLKLKDLTDANAAKLRKLGQEAQSKPEGWQQMRVQGRVETLLQELKGEMGWIDIPMAIWYAHIFSAPPTHLANLVGNSAKLMEAVTLELLHRPVAAPQILRSLARGLTKGGEEAWNVLTTGQVEGARLLKAEPARPLEAKVQQGGLGTMALPWALVGRGLAAGDLLYFKPHQEMKWNLLARRKAREEGLPMAGPKLMARVNELLHNTPAEFKAAKVQAAQEGLTGNDLRRRAHEIIEQQREESMPGSLEIARNHALTQTFNADTYGFIGEMVAVLNNMNRRLVVTRFAMPVVRILGNIINESLAYFPPVGVARVMLSRYGFAEKQMGKRQIRFRNRLDGKPITDADQVFNHTARAVIGLMLFSALAILLAETIDDEDPFMTVYGAGPRTKSKRETLRSQGWMPNSIKLGQHHFSYQETQLAIPLAILGNYYDAIRYGDLEEEDAANRLLYGLAGISHSILDQRMLSGLGDLLDALSADWPGSTGKRMAKWASRVGSSFVVPNAARWADRLFDPQVYEANDIRGALMLEVPLVRREGRPALNVFGQPVTRGPLERFYSQADPDAVVQVLIRKEAWVPYPNINSLEVPDYRLPKDKRRPITEPEYYDLVALAGPEIYRDLHAHVYDLAYMLPEDAQQEVRNIARKRYDAAKAQLFR